MSTEEQKVWGVLTSLDMHGCNKDKICSADSIKDFTKQLCEMIGVIPFGECVTVHFGKRPDIAGFSMTQLIETSLISGHFVDSTASAYIDVFSCSQYDTALVASFAQSYFEAKEIKVTVLNRS